MKGRGEEEIQNVVTGIQQMNSKDKNPTDFQTSKEEEEVRT